MSQPQAAGADVLARVAIVQEQLPHYRVPFFASLRERLAERGVALRLLISDAADMPSQRGDDGHLEWAEAVRTSRVRVGQRSLVWQHHAARLASEDLIIVEQATRNLSNLALIIRSRLGGPPVALWGHGRNLQSSDASSLAERVKRGITRRAPWFFAYNAFSADIIADLGVPRERISVVNNAIDTYSMRRELESLERVEIDAMLRQWNIAGHDLCVYSGGLYSDKRLPFLVEAGDHAYARNPSFELLVMGGGTELPWLRDAAASRPWLHVLGPTFGRAKACAFAASKLLLMPGLVGLVVLDAFVYETPLVTVEGTYHSPEFSYLVSGENGLVLPEGTSPATFGEAVNALMRDTERHTALVAGCQRAAHRYTIEDMAERFALGVVAALESIPARARRS